MISHSLQICSICKHVIFTQISKLKKFYTNICLSCFYTVMSQNCGKYNTSTLSVVHLIQVLHGYHMGTLSHATVNQYTI